MIFNSVTYLVFLSLTICLFWASSARIRIGLLCFSSILFYSFWRPEFALVMVFSASADYVIARAMHSSAIKGNRRKLLWLSLFINLSLLCFFKYLMFFAGSAKQVLAFAGFVIELPYLEIVLPLGISFYTFQTISYTIDVYRKHIKPERDYLTYLCFVTFFPQLVAGPILRAAELIHQLVAKPVWHAINFLQGLRLIAFGLFLKVVLADNIAPFVDSGFGQSPTTLSALDVITLSFLFGFQIYFDFAGYSMIAIGSALLMGIRFPANFNFPYIARSPREFWQRWHISLSSWIRDYLYLPLMGVRPRNSSEQGILTGSTSTPENNPRLRSATVALFLTWAIMGLWHGANWTFVAWGLYHACFVLVYRVCLPVIPFFPLLLRSVAGWAITLFISMMAWIPFRAQSISDAAELYARLFNWENYLWLGLRENAYLVAFSLLIGFLATYGVSRCFSDCSKTTKMIGLWLDTILFGIVLAVLFVFLRPVSQFIYFQF